MIWKTSDVLILLATGIISLNGVIVMIMLCRTSLERKLNMISLSHMLKCIILFSTIIMPVLIFFVLFKLTFYGKIPLKSDDFFYASVIAKQTISSMTNRGDAWAFIVILILWIVGFLYFGVVKIIRTNIALKRLEQYSKECKEDFFVELKNRLMDQLSIKGFVTILFNDIIRSPFTIGTFYPTIFLPMDEYTKEEWELLLKHEMVHCKSRDYFFRKTLFILCAFYWFNPFVYKLSSYFIEINEMACDEIVLNQQPTKLRSMYAALIIKVQEREYVLNAVSLSAYPEKSLERRIKNIMRKNVKTKRWFTAVLTAGVLLMCPMTVMAASYGISSAQDWTVRNILTEEVSEQQTNDAAIEITELLTTEEVVRIPIQITPREAASVNVTINGKKFIKLGTVSLSAKNKVSFSLEADNSSDVFQAGVLDGDNKKTYVKSSEGTIAHTFTVDKAGNYTLFVEGTTTQNVHITGYVYVFSK